MYYNNFGDNKNPFIKQDNLNDFVDKFINTQYMINAGNKNVKDLYEKNGNNEFKSEIGKTCDNRLKNKIEPKFDLKITFFNFFHNGFIKRYFFRQLFIFK